MARTTRKNVYVIGLLLGLFVLLNALWHTPLIYPVKVFTVILHELSHGLAAVLTGGRIVQIEISPELGGVCTTQGGWSFVVLPAGYLGSMALGCLIMLVAARTDYDKHLSVAIGSALLLLVAFYIRTGFGIVFGLLSGVGMILLGRFAATKVNEVVLLFLGVTSALYAVVDIKEDLISRTVQGSDAYQMSELIPLPPVLWGILWILLAIVAVFITLGAALGKATGGEQ